MKHTDATIRDLIKTNDLAAMRAVCAIFRRQTEDERSDSATRHQNARGFSQAHARIGSELARWMDGGRGDGVLRRRADGTFSEWRKVGETASGRNRWKKNVFGGRARVDVCREIALSYVGQLVEIANASE